MSGFAILKREEEIFSSWKSEDGHERFVPDGIVDEATFGSLKDIRPVYLLKEPFDDPSLVDWTPWDMRCYLKQGAYNKWRWRVPARWACHVCGGEEEWALAKDKGSREFRMKWLSYLAVVNIKKTGGQSRCKVSELYSYALEKGYGKKYLLEQVALYAPSFVICGGPDVYNIAKSIHEISHKADDEFYSPIWNCPVLSFFHYAASKNHGDLHYSLVERIKKLI